MSTLLAGVGGQCSSSCVLRVPLLGRLAIVVLARCCEGVRVRHALQPSVREGAGNACTQFGKSWGGECVLSDATPRFSHQYRGGTNGMEFLHELTFGAL